MNFFLVIFTMKSYLREPNIVRKSIFLGVFHNFRIPGRLESHKLTINCINRIPWAKYFVTLLKRKIEHESKHNVLAAREVLLQVS